MKKKRVIALTIIVCAAAALTVGTFARSAGSTLPASTDGYRAADSATAATIGERATTYWQARTRQDLYASYAFYEASFRSTYEPEAFVKTFQRLNRFSPMLAGIERIAVDPSGTRARVLVQLRSKPPLLEGEELVSTTEDVWILANGVWWKQAEALVPTL